MGASSTNISQKADKKAECATVGMSMGRSKQQLLWFWSFSGNKTTSITKSTFNLLLFSSLESNNLAKPVAIALSHQIMVKEI